MRIVFAVVGKPRDKAIAAAIADYESRASRYWSLSVQHVRAGSPRGEEPALVRSDEAARLTDHLAKTGGLVVACESSGRSMTSEQFARWLSTERDNARDVAFVIGGAFGLGEQVLASTAWSLSLAPWTLTHEMARLVLAEQVYRAGTIIRGEPYHK